MSTLRINIVNLHVYLFFISKKTLFDLTFCLWYRIITLTLIKTLGYNKVTMSHILVKFYREAAGESVIIRTEYCDNLFEADAIIEEEAGHYDHVTIIDLDENI